MCSPALLNSRAGAATYSVSVAPEVMWVAQVPTAKRLQSWSAGLGASCLFLWGCLRFGSLSKCASGHGVQPKTGGEHEHCQAASKRPYDLDLPRVEE